ncbi:MAG: hypothetical protein FJ267_03895 [Planctomycetes bacterium]|nr:hypothetical protein [Planctomycetota bacterium]
MRHFIRSVLTQLASPALLVFLAVLARVNTDFLYGEDRVTIQSENGGRIHVSGVIEDLNGRELVIRTRVGDRIRRYHRNEIAEYSTTYLSSQSDGQRLLREGKPDEASSRLNAALDAEDRKWVRREILALLVRCALWKGDTVSAGSRFLSITESDDETIHFNIAPLAWTDDAPQSEVVQAAQNWMESMEPIPRLLGASHCLFDSSTSVQAESMLRILARNPNALIQRLAQMQLWRMRVRSKQTTINDLSRWESAVEDLPKELRGGGYYVLGQASEQLQEPERAARAFLWIPLVYDADHVLAARACYRAAQLVETIGQTEQAITLYRDVVFRYGDTEWGPLAESKWKQVIR